MTARAPREDPSGREPERDGESRVQRLERELLAMSQELARLHREREAQRELLRRERAEREELLCVVSHELRTPVTVIGGYSRLLLSEDVGPLTAEQRKFLEESARGCRRLDAFIEKLLASTHAGQGHEVLEVGQASLVAPLHAVAELFQPMLDEGDLRLSLDIAEDADNARFDAIRLDQVLTNLVGNAVKFTPRGGSIELRTRALATPENAWVRRWVEISVCDDGPGIAAAERARVFEPYVQLGEGSGGGLGLGLAICKRLVEAHGGAIALDERVGRGCCVRFTLPAEAPRPLEAS